MIPPTFYALEGDEQFVPKVSHPHEDAGADIRAHVRVKPNYSTFYTLYHEGYYNSRLYVNGEEYKQDFTVPLEVRENELFSTLSKSEGFALLAPGETLLISGGFKVILPNLKDLGPPWDSFIPVYKIVSKSGLANKHNIVVTNSPGIIDSGYQGWVKVSLTNNGDNYHVFTHGCRIAQGICEIVIDQTDNRLTTDESVFKATCRSSGGFGSTGL